MATSPDRVHQILKYLFSKYLRCRSPGEPRWAQKRSGSADSLIKVYSPGMMLTPINIRGPVSCAW